MNPSVAINGRFRTRRITGVERYAHEISKRLDFPNRFVSPNKPLGQVTGHLWEQFILPMRIRKNEILWSPANAGTWSIANQVITLHDASVFDHPEWFKPSFAAWTRLSWKVLAKRAKAIITVSEFSKQRLKHHLKISDGKTHVIHNGVGKPFEPQAVDCVKAAKEKYGIKKPYFLFVGTIEPRKNLNILLKVWEQLKLETHELFIAGAEGNVFMPVGHTSSVVHTPDTVGHASSVTYMPDEVGHVSNVTYVPDEDLPALHSGATAFVLPSFYEGFGLTALEAMACGAPVIASNTSAFPEVFGDVACLIDPAKPDELASAMKRIIEDRSLSNALREKGLKKAAELSWEKSAEKTQEVITAL